MWKYTFVDTDPYELYHWGILGQKWGIRRFQNPDGTLTEAGKKRYWGHGSEYTPVGRRKYVSDVVKDYNKSNGTKVRARDAVVEIDGKLYDGRGREVGVGISGKNGLSRSSDKLTRNSKKYEFDMTPGNKMTAQELEIARQFYQNYNQYLDQSSKLANAEGSTTLKSIGADAEKRGRAFTAAIIGGLSTAATTAIVNWIVNMAKENSAEISNKIFEQFNPLTAFDD